MKPAFSLRVAFAVQGSCFGFGRGMLIQRDSTQITVFLLNALRDHSCLRLTEAINRAP
jgi:hypothetical protein